MNEQPEVKRGPGRPRKVRETEPVPAVRNLPPVMDIGDIAHEMGSKSRSTARRLVNTDPEFPPAFKLNGQDHWMREDWTTYLKLKAQQARKAKQGQLEVAASPA